MKIEIGQRVEGGDTFETYDTGQVLNIEDEEALVAWDTGVQTEVPIYDLRPVGTFVPPYANDWGMRCPKCGGTTLCVVIKAWAELTSDGTNLDSDNCPDHDHEWNASSPTQCVECGYTGANGEFEVEEGEQYKVELKLWHLGGD